MHYSASKSTRNRFVEHISSVLVLRGLTPKQILRISKTQDTDWCLTCLVVSIVSVLPPNFVIRSILNTNASFFDVCVILFEILVLLVQLVA